MDVEKLVVEIDKFKDHLAMLENRLKEIQEKCDHDFSECDSYYEKCMKCQKVNILYY